VRLYAMEFQPLEKTLLVFSNHWNFSVRFFQCLETGAGLACVPQTRYGFAMNSESKKGWLKRPVGH